MPAIRSFMCFSRAFSIYSVESHSPFEQWQEECESRLKQKGKVQIALFLRFFSSHGCQKIVIFNF
jgi:hypothetical protein